jgi:hypothetical protein
MGDTSHTTLQSIFDRVADHFLGMSGPAQNHKGDCCYRTKDGDRCFVGALIKDEDYSPSIEGLAINSVLTEDDLMTSDYWDRVGALMKAVMSSLTKDYPDLPESMPEDVRVLLTDLQVVHDNWSDGQSSVSRNHVISGMIEVAEERGLSPAKLAYAAANV